MLLSMLGIALAAGSVAGFVLALIYLAKAHVPFFLPLLLGGFCMLLGNLGASFLLLLINALVKAAAGRPFIGDDVAALYLAIATGILMSGSMFFVLKKPLKTRRSAYEALAFGLGIAMPLFAYRAFGAAWTSFALLAAGADYATSALLLAQNAAQLLLALVEVSFAVLLAHLISKGKPIVGLLVALACELAFQLALNVEDAFGWSGWIGTALGLAVFAAALVYDFRAWSSFPPMQKQPRTHGVNKTIPWPEPGEDGR